MRNQRNEDRGAGGRTCLAAVGAAAIGVLAGAGWAQPDDHDFDFVVIGDPGNRPPRAEEKAQAVAFIEGNATGLVDFCQTMLNLNEFVYRQ